MQVFEPVAHQSFASQKLCGFSLIPNSKTTEFKKPKLCIAISQFLVFLTNNFQLALCKAHKQRV